MFIQTEETPNPDAIKFLPNIIISKGNPQHFENTEQAKKKSILAAKLFDIDGVAAVFFGNDFITITKSEEKVWHILKPEILMTIQDHLLAGFPIYDNQNDSLAQNQDLNDRDDLSEIEKQIIEIIDTRVRPSVAADGGDIKYISFIDGIVRLELRGACSNCPSSSITLKNGIESMLQHFIPEVKAVEAAN